jgi:hypothetical protein
MDIFIEFVFVIYQFESETVFFKMELKDPRHVERIDAYKNNFVASEV